MMESPCDLKLYLVTRERDSFVIELIASTAFVTDG